MIFWIDTSFVLPFVYVAAYYACDKDYIEAIIITLIVWEFLYFVTSRGVV